MAEHAPFLALTLTQPWATLVAVGAKTIETRSWRTDYRGPIAIHAGAGLGPVGGRRGLHELCAREPFASALIGAGHSAHLMPAWGLPLGAIVAVAELVGCAPTGDGVAAADELGFSHARGYRDYRIVDAHEYAFGDYGPGRWLWMLEDVCPLARPVPARGALGLWAVPEAVRAEIAAALDSERNDHHA